MTVSNEYIQTKCVVCKEYIEIDKHVDVEDGHYAHISCLDTVCSAILEPEETEYYNNIPDQSYETHIYT